VAEQRARTVAPAKGKLGVLCVGLGAVASTFIAGVESIRRGQARPIGSLTQMGTIRLGKRTRPARRSSKPRSRGFSISSSGRGARSPTTATRRACEPVCSTGTSTWSRSRTSSGASSRCRPRSIRTT
jgi:hypothetical protein